MYVIQLTDTGEYLRFSPYNWNLNKFGEEIYLEPHISSATKLPRITKEVLDRIKHLKYKAVEIE